MYKKNYANLIYFPYTNPLDLEKCGRYKLQIGQILLKIIGFGNGRFIFLK